MEKPEQIWFLLSRNLSGEATPDEKEALMKALQQQPDLMQQYELLQRLWKPGHNNSIEEIETKIGHILRRSANETAATDQLINTPSTENKFRFLKIARWAAALVGISLAVWTYTTLGPTARKDDNEIFTKKGSKTRTLLPDGSTVFLNAGSSIVYDPNFSGNTREVTLQGEAYFDIVKQPEKPFIVHAGDINIRVLGTAFNVKSYAEEPTIETTLIRGQVQITYDTYKKGDPIYLHPNQKIVLPKIGITLSKETTDTSSEAHSLATRTTAIVNLDTSLRENERLETAWIYNRLEFRSDRFEGLAKKLERWYNITIHFEDEQVRSLAFTGSMENETVEQAFRALSVAVPFQFEIKGNDVYIKSIKTTE
jgi:ferric-dicitrate binding protein FerR (iron transport regulator)